MGDWFAGSITEQIFLVSALAGGLFFLLRLGMSVLGGDAHSSDAGAGAGDGGHHPGDTDSSFHVLTIQGVTAFFLFGGLIGLAATRQFGIGEFLATGAAVLVGALAMFANAWFVKLLLGLQMVGTLKVENAVGKEGVVYLTIHPDSGGQVQLELQGSLHTFEAVCESGKEIATGERVWVVGIVNGGTLSVEKLPA